MKPVLYWCVCWLVLTFGGASAQIKSLSLIKEESSVTYRLVHPLHNVEATSKEMQYRLDVDIATKRIKRVAVQVDVTSFNSGNSNRDSHAMEVIDAITYPDVRFISTTITQTGDSLSVAGKLTFHGVTRDVGIAGVSKWTDEKLVVEGGFQISLEAFEVERPSLLMIPVKDTLSFSIVAAFSW